MLIRWAGINGSDCMLIRWVVDTKQAGSDCMLIPCLNRMRHK
ncbi:MAG: hypothetical protein QX196_08510 [Methylococcaceae bacterium]